MPKQPSVLVLYNEPVLPNDHPDSEAERDILDTLGEVVRVLQAAGFVVRKLGINLDPRPLISEVKRRRPAAVFNLFEGVPTRPGSEVAVAALLEWLDIPFTGCPSFALAMGRDKIRSKYMMAAAGVPTAKFEVIESEPVPDWTSSWPVIVKPAYEDASVGIDQASVATDQAQLAARVRYVFERFGPPVLVEEFVDGREFHVNVIEEGDKDQRVADDASLAEIAFKRDAPDLWPVYTYTAKWDENSAEYKDCPLHCPDRIAHRSTASRSRTRDPGVPLLPLSGLRTH